MLLRAIQKSFGVTVDYLHGHYSIENSHEAFVRGGTNVHSPDFSALCLKPRGHSAPSRRSPVVKGRAS